MEEGMCRRPSFLLPGFRLMRVFRPYWEDPRFTAIMDGLWPGPHKKVLGPCGWQPAAGGLIHRFQGRPLAIRCRCRPSDHQRTARSPQAGQRNWSSRGPETRTI